MWAHGVGSVFGFEASAFASPKGSRGGRLQHCFGRRIRSLRWFGAVFLIKAPCPPSFVDASARLVKCKKHYRNQKDSFGCENSFDSKRMKRGALRTLNTNRCDISRSHAQEFKNQRNKSAPLFMADKL